MYFHIDWAAIWEFNSIQIDPLEKWGWGDPSALLEICSSTAITLTLTITVRNNVVHVLPDTSSLSSVCTVAVTQSPWRMCFDHSNQHQPFPHYSPRRETLPLYPYHWLTLSFERAHMHTYINLPSNDNAANTGIYIESIGLRLALRTLESPTGLSCILLHTPMSELVENVLSVTTNVWAG